ncbi:MAG: adenylyl cyclase, partial [Pseudomonadota bacterium]
MGYWAELNRRNVVRAVGAFLVGGWLLLQIATALEEAMDLPAWFDTFIAALLVIGLPVVAVFSWAYEITPEGLRKTSDIDTDVSITGETGQRLDKITLAGVVLIIGLFAYQQFAGQPGGSDVSAPSTQTAGAEAPAATVESAVAEADAGQSIAVLPFVAMSQSKDDEFFADGLSEELLNVLANISGLKVAGRTSSFYYKGKNEDLREIAGALGVANILEGSVRRSGDTLRVTAQLIQAKDGFHLWSETFDRDDGDTFAIQDEIASSVARALQSELIGITQAKPTTPRNVEAQNLYLVAQAALAERNLTDVKRARDLFAQARELSPETPRYASGYAHAVSLMYWNFRALGPDEAISEASKAIEQALASGPPSADTLAIAGLV